MSHKTWIHPVFLVLQNCLHVSLLTSAPCLPRPFPGSVSLLNQVHLLAVLPVQVWQWWALIGSEFSPCSWMKLSWVKNFIWAFPPPSQHLELLFHFWGLLLLQRNVLTLTLWGWSVRSPCLLSWSFVLCSFSLICPGLNLFLLNLRGPRCTIIWGPMSFLALGKCPSVAFYLLNCFQWVLSRYITIP